MPNCEKCILLLPNPDLLQMANVGRYNIQSGYNAVFTMTTMPLYDRLTRNRKGGGFVPSLRQPTIGPETKKIVIVGHGDPGGVAHTTVDEIVECLLESGASFDDVNPLKIKFDNCYAASPETSGVGVTITESVLTQVRAGITAAFNPTPVNIVLSGAQGPTVTAFTGTPVMRVGRYYLTPDNAIIQKIGLIQDKLCMKHGLSKLKNGIIKNELSELYQSYNCFIGANVAFNDAWESATIIHHAQLAQARIKGFLDDFKVEIDKQVLAYNLKGISLVDKGRFKVTVP